MILTMSLLYQLLYLTMKNQFKSVKGPRKHLMNQLKSSLIQLVEIEDVVNIILGIYSDELWNLYACLRDFLLCFAADKSLTEMPEDEIDPKKIPFRDLIRLREYTERSEIKEAAKLKTPASNQRDRVGTSSFSLNYTSFMEKPRPVKWSEQDTELFYEGIELFGTDFDMVALLFPGRTRNHIKFKHKKESRQNPLGIHQPKDSSRYAQLMNELLKVARQMQKSNSDGLSDMEDLEEEEMTHDNNEEVTKPDKIEDMETDVADEVQYEEAAEVHSPMKSNQSDHGDGFSGWDDIF